MVHTAVTIHDVSPSSLSLLTFRLGSRIFALPLEPVIQIVPIVAITPLPESPDTMLGVINVHGKMVPVIDLRKLFNLPDSSLQLYTPIILVRLEAPKEDLQPEAPLKTERILGLVVDEVTDVERVDQGHVASLDGMLSEDMEPAPVLSAILQIRGQMIPLLELKYLLKADQVSALIRALDHMDMYPLKPDPGAFTGEQTRLNEGRADPVEPDLLPDPISERDAEELA